MLRNKSFRLGLTVLSVLFVVVLCTAEKSWAPDPEWPIGVYLEGPSIDSEAEIHVFIVPKDGSGGGHNLDITITGTCSADGQQKTVHWAEDIGNFGYHPDTHGSPVEWLSSLTRMDIQGMVALDKSPGCGSIDPGGDIILVNSEDLQFGFRALGVQIMFPK